MTKCKWCGDLEQHASFKACIDSLTPPVAMAMMTIVLASLPKVPEKTLREARRIRAERN